MAPGWEPADVLALTASADQVSPHVLAEAVVAEARSRGLPLVLPDRVEERAGWGVTAEVDGRRVHVGRRDPVPDAAWARRAMSRASLDGGALVWVDVDGEAAGVLLLKDPLRPEANRTLRRLRAAGIDRLLMLTGDRSGPAREVGEVLGLDEVRAEQQRAVTVMVGDGINDAPALAAATVGVAMGARGATAASQAADVVLTTDRLDRLADAMEIARRARRIAVQSAGVGMGLSLIAMLFAAAGLLPPAAGALLQEAIDVAVILNALRALRGGGVGGPALQPETQELLQRFAEEHTELREVLPQLRSAADELAAGPTPQALSALRRARTALVEQLVPHEEAQEAELFPALEQLLGGPDAIAPMARAHAEINRLTRRLDAHLEPLTDVLELSPERRQNILASLYGLHALLHLHYLQEEENVYALVVD